MPAIMPTPIRAIPNPITNKNTQPTNLAKNLIMGNLFTTAQIKSAPRTRQAIALPTEGGDRFLLDLTQHPDYPFEPRQLSDETIYELALSAEGIPNDLAKHWANGVAAGPNSKAPGDVLARGLYRYFVLQGGAAGNQ